MNTDKIETKIDRINRINKFQARNGPFLVLVLI